MFRPTVTIISFGTAALLVSGCGGSSTGGASFDELAAEGLSLLTEYETAEITPVENLPGGKATYEGVAAFSQTPTYEAIVYDADVVSAMTLTADFEANTIDGKLYNFRDFDNESFSGTVDINNGAIVDNTLSADLSGNLNAYGDPLLIDGEMEGAFIGENAEAVIGVTEATADADTWYGIFGGER